MSPIEAIIETAINMDDPGRRRAPYVEPVRSALEAAGQADEIVVVPYEFRRAEGQAGRLMMRAYRRG